ncbi:hypothetical protein [Phormidium sp. CCY1219]|uniref:hypothetical protein n=1 Tax=Phormidium sp. CCY1219 TaxID=2886104 RepID=UPI002D1E9FF4|nr:hypothetical protein [Phormidium sp. CCY1219]MEB3830481.1 hypothetical protein [Phormidium sp. CCY1219]
MSDMKQAYKIAAAAVRERFAEQHPDYLEIIDTITPKDVAVYSGSYDRVEDILTCLGLPMTMNPDANKLEAKIVFANCSDSYSETLVKQLPALVQNGTWLVSSDWALGKLLQPAFPHTVRWNNRYTGDEVISVEASLHSLWSEVVVLGADPQWWLESSSHPIEIANPDKVRIEAASHDLLARHQAPIVAVSFDWGKGQVFHVISHFWCKRSRSPTPRHLNPCTDFLEAGMRLSESGIAKVLRDTKSQPKTVNFAQLQSAATATELVAQLCVGAVRGDRPTKSLAAVS